MEKLGYMLVWDVGSLVIYGVVTGKGTDKVIMGINDEKPKEYTRYCNTKGYYVKWRGKRYYLDGFVRVGRGF